MKNVVYWAVMTPIAYFLILWGLLVVSGNFLLTAMVGIAILAGVMVACTLVICAKLNKILSKKSRDLPNTGIE